MKNQDKKTGYNRVSNLGDFAVNGGPGRPKGSLNKFTIFKVHLYSLFKLQLFEVWQEENGKEKFRELFRGSKKDFLRALDKIFAIALRERDVDRVVDKEEE